MNKRAYIIGGGVALVGILAVKKGIAVSKAVPKFRLPRNFSRSGWNLNFELPFTIANTTTTGYTIDGLGGSLYYTEQTQKLPFASFYLQIPIDVKANSNDTYFVKCTTYLPDVIGSVKAIVKVINKPVNFEAVGSVRFLGISIPFDESVKVTFISEIVTLLKTVATVFKSK